MVDKEKIMSELIAGVTTIVFTKQNGERRVMKCTLNDAFLPEQEVGTILIEEKKEKDLPYQVVWDMEADGWRSFKWASVITEETKDV